MDADEGLASRGAVVWETGQGVRAEWKIEDLVVSHPQEGEVLVRLRAAGLCHSDNHYSAGDGEVDFAPFLGGHEGAGVVERVGPGVQDLAVGDHVTCTFMPSCGRCVWCRRGRGNLCDRGAGLMQGVMLDGTRRIRTAAGDPVGPMTYLGTFSELIVAPEDSLIKIDPSIPFPAAAVVGCAVPTGWGTAVNIAGVEIGDVVVVIGAGGVGMNAVQGARQAGARAVVVVDPAELKREECTTFGGTHAAASIEEAAPIVSDLTQGVMADRVIITMGVVDGEMIEPALGLVSKGGVLAIGGVASMYQTDTKLSLFGFVMTEKQIRGGLYGGCLPAVDIPRLLGMYQRGELLIDELVTRTYRLEEINEAYRDMEEGRNIRGVILYD